jgi:antitoxin component YwqK of YwqJK toxin-antitoxin module
MNRLSYWRNNLLAVASCGVALAALPLAGRVDAQVNEDVEVETITPYTGPPIFLDEAEPPPPAQFVEKEVHTEKFEDGSVRVERELTRYSDNHREAEGFYREYYPGGQKFVEGQFRSGARQGEWTYWHPDGTTNRTVTYDKGQLDGSWETYRADGTLAAKRGFKQGIRHGEWITYDESGKQPLTEEHYVEGKPDGVWKGWYPSGQLLRQIGFDEGVRSGDAIEWDEKGNKRAELTYVDGKPHGTVSVWAAAGRKFTQQYENGKLVSQSVEK